MTERAPWYTAGRCNDCGLSASHCNCDKRCLCGSYYRPGRDEHACHRLIGNGADNGGPT